MQQLIRQMRMRFPEPLRHSISRSAVGRRVADWQERRELEGFAAKVGPLTMVREPMLVELASWVRHLVRTGVPGDLVECGVWRGGASFVMASVLRSDHVTDRKVWLFDSFEGLPPPEEIDGDAATAWASDPGAPGYYDNCCATVEEVEASAAALGLASHTTVVKGWFEDTLPTYRDRVGDIALLRIDCDWYESVKCCLNNLYDQVAHGGLVVIDDYFVWDGCAIAVHEFLSERRLPHRLRTAEGLAYFVKA